MDDYIYFSNNNINSNYNNYNKEKIKSMRPIMAFSLKNISTTFNSHTPKDFQTNNNEIERKKDSILLKKNNKKIISKTINNYYHKKNYQKFLNIPQSPFSSIYGDFNNNSYFKKNAFNQINYNKSLNSNLDKKYNRLNIHQLLEISKKRKQILEEKREKEQLKKEKILKEQEKISNIIISLEDNNQKKINITKNNLCEEGVQTSIKIKEEKNIGNIMKKKENILNIYNDSVDNNINFNNKNLKHSKNSDIDLVNIGNETEEILNEDNKNKNNNINNKINELNFNIEKNNSILSNIRKKEDQITLSIDSKTNNDEKKDYQAGKKIGNNEDFSKSSSIKEIENSEIEEYDINKINLQNETKSIIFDSLNNLGENNDLRITKNKSILSKEKNGNNYIINKNDENSNNNNLIEKNSKKNINETLNNKLELDSKISKKENNINYIDDNIKKTSKNNIHKKNINSCNNRFNKNIIINRKIIKISKKVLLLSNLKDNSFNINNNVNFKTDGFRRKNSDLNIISSNNYISSKKICNKIKNKINVLPSKRNNNDENKNKKKRQLDNYADYFKIRSISKENMNHKINIG